jgi:hypothetical protein
VTPITHRPRFSSNFRSAAFASNHHHQFKSSVGRTQPSRPTLFTLNRLSPASSASSSIRSNASTEQKIHAGVARVLRWRIQGQIAKVGSAFPVVPVHIAENRKALRVPERWKGGYVIPSPLADEHRYYSRVDARRGKAAGFLYCTQLFHHPTSQVWLTRRLTRKKNVCRFVPRFSQLVSFSFGSEPRFTRLTCNTCPRKSTRRGFESSSPLPSLVPSPVPTLIRSFRLRVSECSWYNWQAEL